MLVNGKDSGLPYGRASATLRDIPPIYSELLHYFAFSPSFASVPSVRN